MLSETGQKLRVAEGEIRKLQKKFFEQEVKLRETGEKIEEHKAKIVTLRQAWAAERRKAEK